MKIKKNKELYVDEFVKYGIDRNSVKEKYARWVLFHYRLEPVYRSVFDDLMQDFKLFCEFDDKKYRVIGATWSGKVWLSLDIKEQGKYQGYDVSVYPSKCSKWSKT